MIGFNLEVSVNILHISDIHFGRNYERTNIKEPFIKRKNILDELVECIGNIREDEKPEHIVVTGDIAWWGKKDEYEEAKEWFTRLLHITGLTGKNISFCVGNHDVNWNYGKNIDDIKDNTIDAVDEAYEYSNAHKYEAVIQEYEAFCSDLGVEPYKYFVNEENVYSFSIGYKDVEFPSGSIIRLVAFNTAMLSYGRNINEDKMWIGKPQIETLMQYGILPKGKASRFSIALMHHAERFLHPNEISEYEGRTATLPLLMDNVDLILCGHTETGGKPVLREQAGGGKSLTAGATYYNDVHPNSFSMIYVPDEGEGIALKLYMYKNGWKVYQEHKNSTEIKKVKSIPPTGAIQEKCEFILKADEKSYRILLRAISVTLYTKNGAPYCRLDNKKDVSRNLDVMCEGPLAGGTANAVVKLSSRKEESVEAMLEAEKYFFFLDKIVRPASHSEFYIKSNSGAIVLKGNNMNISKEAKSEERGIKILEKLVRIERAFDIRLVRPNDVYEFDDIKTDLLIELIEKGHTDKIRIGNIVDFNVNSLDKISYLYDKACSDNRFMLVHKGNYVCDFFGYTIKMKNYYVVSEIYKVDLEDVKSKIDTYKEGDIRKVILNALENQKTYFIADEQTYFRICNECDCEEIGILHMGINNDFIK